MVSVIDVHPSIRTGRRAGGKQMPNELHIPPLRREGSNVLCPAESVAEHQHMLHAHNSASRDLCVKQAAIFTFLST